MPGEVAEVGVEQAAAEVEQGRDPVTLPLQIARVAMAAGCLHRTVIIPTRIIAVKAIRAELKGVGLTRVMRMVERVKATAEVEESEEMRIGVAEMAIPGTGTIRGRGKVRPQAK
jgi:hypothetical protein